MANNHTNLTDLFTDIADAIRVKTGGTDTIVADAFPEAIAAIDTQKSISATDDGNGNVTIFLSGYTATYNNGNITIE